MEAGCVTGQYSQRNLSDDVYDAVFEDLRIIKYNEDTEEADVFYDSQLHGLELAWCQIKKWWSKIINWFVANL